MGSRHCDPFFYLNNHMRSRKGLGHKNVMIMEKNKIFHSSTKGRSIGNARPNCPEPSFQNLEKGKKEEI